MQFYQQHGIAAHPYQLQPQQTQQQQVKSQQQVQPDPNADTEWNDILRAKGILPEKQEKEITEDDIVNILETTVEKKLQGKGLDEMTLGELNENEDDIDEEDERMFEQYRQQRLMEMRAAQAKSRYGDVLEISKADYVREVNQAGDGVWVVLHVYKQEIPLCKLINQHMSSLARKFPDVKFIKSVSTVCIPNYPDKNLPTIFVYHEGDMKKQWIGPLHFGGMHFKIDDMEWMLSEVGVLKTTLEERPRRQVEDEMERAVKRSQITEDDSDDDDW